MQQLSWRGVGDFCYVSEALAIRDRALAGKGGGIRLQWDESTRKQRVEEVMGRMQGPREPLWRLLGAWLYQ
jgi:hypothetical protein